MAKKHSKSTIEKLGKIRALTVAVAASPAPLEDTVTELHETALALMRHAKEQAAYWSGVEKQVKELIQPVVETTGNYTDGKGGGFWMIAPTTKTYAKGVDLALLAKANPRKFGWLTEEGYVYESPVKGYLKGI